MRPNFLGKVAIKTTFLLNRHDFSTRHQASCIFFHSQLQCGILLNHNFDIIDLRTHRVGCGDSHSEGCDVGTAT